MDQRAAALQKELEERRKDTMHMMMMMQRNAQERQNQFDQTLLELKLHQQQVPQQIQQRPRGGLLTGLLSPVTGLLDGLLGGGLVGGLLNPITQTVDGLLPLGGEGGGGLLGLGGGGGGGLLGLGGGGGLLGGLTGGLTGGGRQGQGGLLQPVTNTLGGATHAVDGLAGGLGVGGLTRPVTGTVRNLTDYDYYSHQY